MIALDRPEGPEPDRADRLRPPLDRVRLEPDDAIGSQDRPLREFREAYPGEYIEPLSRTTPTERFAPPETTVHRINPLVGQDEAYRVNCADCARAVERTWRGDREEAAGCVDLDGEQTDRTEAWAGQPAVEVVRMDDVRARLERAGHGASAIVHTQFRDRHGDRGGHAFNVVNHDGTVTVVDGQHGYAGEWAGEQGHPVMVETWDVRAFGWDAERRPLWPC